MGGQASCLLCVSVNHSKDVSGGNPPTTLVKAVSSTSPVRQESVHPTSPKSPKSPKSPQFQKKGVAHFRDQRQETKESQLARLGASKYASEGSSVHLMNDGHRRRQLTLELEKLSHLSEGVRTYEWTKKIPPVAATGQTTLVKECAAGQSRAATREASASSRNESFSVESDDDDDHDRQRLAETSGPSLQGAKRHKIKDIPLSPQAQSTRCTPSENSKRSRSSMELEDDEVEMLKLEAKPRKLVTQNGELIRSVTRTTFDAISQAPFTMRLFCSNNLANCPEVNSGQLLGFSSQKGGEVCIPNQDEFAILHEAGYQIYLVTDGQGESGEGIATFCRQWLCAALLDLVRERQGKVIASGQLSALFAKMLQAVKKEEARGQKSQCYGLRDSGCSVTVAILTPSRSLRGAWVGSCECIGGRRARSSQVQLFAPAHTIGGNRDKLTRAVGLTMQAGMRSDADEFSVPDVDLAGLDFLILGSGGLWRGVTRAQATALVAEAGPSNAQHASCNLTATSQETQMVVAEQTLGPAAVQDATAIAVWIGTSD